MYLTCWKGFVKAKQFGIKVAWTKRVDEAKLEEYKKAKGLIKVGTPFANMYKTVYYDRANVYLVTAQKPKNLSKQTLKTIHREVWGVWN